MNKRDFLKTSALLGLGGLVSLDALGRTTSTPKERKAGDDFWGSIRAEYELPGDYIYLENGYYNIMPRPIMGQYIRHIREVNHQGSYYMRTVQQENKQRVAAKLAELAGCSKDELIITRNTTESLNMVIAGINWKKKDEAVMAEQDYGAMLDMFKQVSKRYGTVNKVISIPLEPASDEEIVRLYENAITAKTKLLMVCHMINITGQILPVRKICDMAHKKGVPVLIDGAHSFAHLDFKITDLNCDFYGCSLHKWLSAPLGAGMLYVKKDRVKDIWPLFAEHGKQDDDILKLNHTGTHPVATDLAIEAAIDYYKEIGADKKEERLRYLQRHWTEMAREIPNVMLYTPKDPARACGIATVGIKDMKPSEMADRLFREYKIYTVGIDNAGVHGCRITPNLYTTKGEVETLTKALRALAKG